MTHKMNLDRFQCQKKIVLLYADVQINCFDVNVVTQKF